MIDYYDKDCAEGLVEEASTAMETPANAEAACTLCNVPTGPDLCCPTCGASLSNPCEVCGGYGHHTPACSLDDTGSGPPSGGVVPMNGN